MTVTPAHPNTTPDLTDLAQYLDAAEPRQALLSAHAMSQELERWQQAMTARRDDYVLKLWLEGTPAMQIAQELGESSETVRSILAQRRTQGSWEQRQEYARRAAREYTEEAAQEPGNLFAAEDLCA